MAQMNISNTLWNDTRDAIIAYAKQLHDNTIDWTNSGKKYNGEYENPDYDPEDPSSPQYLPIMPSDYTSNSNSKLQNSLNEFFLNHWADFQTFLHDHDLEDETINTWRELQDFLKNLPDDEAEWLFSNINRLDNRITAMDTPDGGAYDVSADHVDGGGTYARYATLPDAIAAIPTERQKPGMTIRFIKGSAQSSDNKYVQFRYMGTATTGSPNPFTNPANWQGIDEEPTAGSKNLVESGGVEKKYIYHDSIIQDYLIDDYVLRNGYITVDNIFNYSNVGKGIIREIFSGDVIHTISGSVLVAFTKNNIYEDGEVIFSEVEGFTNRFLLTTTKITAPNDAKYLWVFAFNSSGVEQQYKSVLINNKPLNVSFFKQQTEITHEILMCDSGATANHKTLNNNSIKIFNGCVLLVKMQKAHTTEGEVLFSTNSQDSTTVAPLYYRGMPVTNINTWANDEILTIYYDGTNWYAIPFLQGAQVGFILPIGNFTAPNYDTSTKKLTNIPTTFNVVGNGYGRRVNYDGGDITFVNQGGRDQALVYDRSDNTLKTLAFNNTLIVSSSIIILGMVDTITGNHWFTFEYKENNLPVVRNTYDSEPTANSLKLLTSGAVKAALDNIQPSPVPTIGGNAALMAQAAHYRKIDRQAFVDAYFDGLYQSGEASAYNAFLTKIQARKTTGVYQMAFITDTHEGGQYVMRDLYAFRCIDVFNRIANSVDICAHGGDISCDYGTSLQRYFAYLQEAIEMYKIPSAKNFLITKGNHDTNENEYSEISPLDVDWESETIYYVSPSYNSFETVTKDTYRGGELFIHQTDYMPDSMFRFIQAKNAPVDAVWGVGAYYYYDVEDYNIRFIVANSYPYDDEGVLSENTEYKWFMQTALDLSAKKPTSTNWLVVCIRHSESTSLAKFNRIVSAFMTGGSATEEGITINYGTLNGGGIRFIHLHGHEHDTAGYSNMAGYLDLGFKNGCITKNKLGNASKYPVYVLSVDTVNNKLISDCIEGDVTIEYDYNNNIVNLTIGQSILMARSGMSSQTAATWVSSDSSIATVGEHTGIVTGVADGTVTITGTEGTKVRTYTIKVVS